MDFPKILRENEGVKLEQELFFFEKEVAVGRKKESFSPMKLTKEGKIQKATVAELEQLEEMQLPVYQRLWKSFHWINEMMAAKA